LPNLKSFGAKGDGVTDDTAAIKAALAAVGNGLLLIDPGIYYIGSPPIVVPNLPSLLGSGVPASQFIGPSQCPSPLIQIAVPWGTVGWQFQHGGEWSGFGIDGRKSGCIGISILNSLFVKMRNLGIANCLVGIDLEVTSTAYFEERLAILDSTFSYNGAGIRFNNQTNDPGNSFEYGKYLGLHFNTAVGQCLFKLVNCGNSQSGSGINGCSFEAKGNMQGGDFLFDCSDGSNIGLYCDGLIVAETGATASTGPSVAFHGPPAVSGLTSSLWGLFHTMISGLAVLQDGQWREFNTEQYCAGAESAWSVL
jgi:hypothetical protein